MQTLKQGFIMPTLTSYKNRIRDYAAENGHTVSERGIKTMARKLHQRQSRMQDEDMECIFSHSDPTPRDAIRNIERQTQ